ncbi:alpha/beta fold hydrolase [Aliidiomarina sp. Khilg15.8]
MAISTPQQWLAARPADSDDAWAAWAATELSEFWQQVEQHELHSADGLTIRYAVYENPQSEAWLVISPGRIEGYIKYQELMLEAAAKGYSVAVIDHRGQGFSERESDNPQHGHVTHFNDFVRDFSDFMLALSPRIGEQPCHLLAHSMGGAIASLYMASYPHPFRNAVLSSPMMGIQTGPLPDAAVSLIVRLGHWVNDKLAGNRPRYFLGMTDYTDLPFDKNQLTHSARRYEWFRKLYQDYPQIQVGGPTVQWLMQSLEAMGELPEAANFISIPVLVLQATEDHIVTPEPQRAFVDQLQHPSSRLHKVAGSYHEVLMEKDSIRAPALETAFTFMHHEREALAADAPPKRRRKSRAGARLRS